MGKRLLTTVILTFFTIGIIAQPLVIERNYLCFNDWESTAASGSFGGSNVQEGLNVGLSLSTPISKANKIVPVGFLLDVNFLIQSDRNLALGIAFGYGWYFGKDTDDTWGPITTDSEFRYVPFAIATRYALNSGLIIGGDIGYAYVFSNDYTGGAYYRPVFGYNFSKKMQLNISYTGIANDWIWSAINFGVTLNLSD
ncbi:hypothetical protein ACFFVB_04165 [Formosa undariae]|uniref:Outer membrane protein beta-barrel domain-containing protein n=1 Tax=Formosa undariae TaxID=1325436 RepID=A0ABV5EYQ8_9FLAO